MANEAGVRTVELEIRPPRLARELPLPLVVLLNRVLPVLAPLRVLAALLRVRLQAQALRELALPVEPRGLARSELGAVALFDDL